MNKPKMSELVKTPESDDFSIDLIISDQNRLIKLLP
jgi:hypothetical protein